MKIMIVDDEVIIRTGLAKVIPWHELGLTLLTPAASAEEVLDRLPIEKPDILLTDIRMTGKSGLELAEEAMRLLPGLEVIILSGYDDFMYTQQAIRQNVSDYLLKTSKPDEIIRTVLKVKQRAQEKRKSQSIEYRKQLEERNRRLVGWIVEGNREQAKGMRLPRGNPPWQVVLLLPDGWGESESEQGLLQFAVNNAVCELLPCISFIHNNQVIVVLPSSELDRAHRRHVFDHVQRVLKCRMVIVGGEPSENGELLNHSYATAREALTFRMFFRETSWEYQDIVTRMGGKNVCTYEEERALTAILLEHDPISLKNWVHGYVQAHLNDPQATPLSVEASLQSVALAALRWLARAQTAIGKGSGIESRFALFRIQDSAAPHEDLFQYLYSIMKFYHERLADGKTTHVRKAIHFIEERIGLDLGLHQVAEYVHVHPNHLSELFKKETGMKFVDFVAQTKMKKAMDILSTTPAKISDVAAKVGYEDVKYFGQMFKKHTGLTPSQFREQSLRKRNVQQGLRTE